MGIRHINNKRPADRNLILRNGQPKEQPQEFTLPTSVVRTVEERDAIVAGLEMFLQIMNSGLKLQDRDFDADQQLMIAAQRVLDRL